MANPRLFLIIAVVFSCVFIGLTTKSLIDSTAELSATDQLAHSIGKVARQKAALRHKSTEAVIQLGIDDGTDLEDLDILDKTQWSLLRSNRTQRLVDKDEDVNISPTRRLMICAKVGNEIPYLVEWIEFHRIQGFTKFALYMNDIPTDPQRRVNSNQLVALQRMYEEAGDVGLIDLHPLAILFENAMNHILDPSDYPTLTSPLHRLSQQSLLKHCWETYRQDTEWIAHIDIDEFIHAPKHKSIADFMETLYTGGHGDYTSGSLPLAYQYGNMSGTYLWPMNFGMSTPWVVTPRMGLRSSSMTGKSELIFNPKVNQEGGNMTALLNWLETAKIDLHNIDSVRLFFEELLRKELKLQTPWSEYERYVEPVFETPSIQAILTGGASLKDKLELLLDRVDSRIAEDFPLVIAAQTTRMVSVDYGDPYAQVAEAMIKIYPHCAEYVNKLRQPANRHLRMKAARHEREAKLGVPSHPECVPGELPPSITNVGKTIFWTGNRYNPPSSWAIKSTAYVEQRNALNKHTTNKAATRPRHNKAFDWNIDKMDICVMPWVHHCAHKSWAPIVLANIITELRLDHHMMRSLESRTIGDADWRVTNQKLGKFVHGEEVDFGVMRFLMAVDDKSKEKYIPELRRRIARLKPIPMVAQIQLSPEELVYTTQWNHTACHLKNLLQRLQSMCPRTHVFAGVLGHQIPPPIGFQPYSWCSNTTGELEQFLRRGVVDDPELIACLADLEDASAVDATRLLHCQSLTRFGNSMFDPKDQVFCHDWPLANCCDYDEDIIAHTRSVQERLGLINYTKLAEERSLGIPDWVRTSLINMKGQW
eukprot:Blabericola_migrator_1__12926@NODE_84_length_14850_cov_98_458703_g75_i0_p2_GENE_NODE_84_length_14850_cov_98_458703_g75_i0NODE_84_length_14850_cov_98_458703_g75_i0_p2_ORF_typecomplete_len819_score103_52Glyco_transf_92/PF01697_27/5_9e22Glyco_tranf_2_4/PF13704_6/3_2e10Glyco_tranf_2_4/PF13704_6/1_1e04Glyco_tranf_2_4/PF13704_6/4_7e03_NODE_84_length_14850_cov_98_458703_g75_i09193375